MRSPNFTEMGSARDNRQGDGPRPADKRDQVALPPSAPVSLIICGDRRGRFGEWLRDSRILIHGHYILINGLKIIKDYEK